MMVVIYITVLYVVRISSYTFNKNQIVKILKLCIVCINNRLACINIIV